MNERIIKFRALSSDSGRVWCYGFYTEENGVGYIRNKKGFVIRVDRATVGQFNGRTDSNGTEIYWDDIITFDLKECFGEPEKRGLKNVVGPFTFFGPFRENIKVIGNIHEHPNLI